MADLIGFLAIGCAAGWLSGALFQGRGFGLKGNLAVGIAGSLLGWVGYLLLGASAQGPWGKLVSATLGSVLLLMLLGMRPRGGSD